MATNAIHTPAPRHRAHHALSAPAAVDAPEGKAPVANNDPTKTVTGGSKVSGMALMVVTALLVALMLYGVLVMLID